MTTEKKTAPESVPGSPQASESRGVQGAAIGNLTLGEFLRQERERRGIAIEQVASATKINVKMLHALEADQYSQLPARPFVRGFVKSYSRFIGMDSQEVLIHFDPFINQKLNAKAEEVAVTDAYALEKKGNEQTKTVLWFVMGGCVLIGGIIILALKPSLKHQKQSPIEQLRAIHAKADPTATGAPVAATAAQKPETGKKDAAPTATAEKKLASTEAVQTPTEKQQEEDAPEQSADSVGATSTQAEKEDELNSGRHIPAQEIRHRIVVKFGERSWVRYQSDDRPPMKMLLFRDAVLVLRARNMIKFQTSSLETTQYSYNRQGYRALSDAPNLATRQGTPTLIFPIQATEKIEEPFPGDGPLPAPPSED